MALRNRTEAAVRLSTVAPGKPDAAPAAAGLSVAWPPEAGGDTDFPELVCVRPLVQARALAAAELRAERLGIGADRALIAAGAIDEETYLRTLGEHIGVRFDSLVDTPRTRCPLPDTRLIEAAAAGVLPIIAEEGLCLVVVPRGTAARRIATLVGADRPWAARLRFTSNACLHRFVLRCAGSALGDHATTLLARTRPELSAAPPCRFTLRRAAGALTAAALALLAPAPALAVAGAGVSALFATWFALRLAGVFVPPPVPTPLPEVTDRGLPVYTVIAALYYEAASVDGLLRAIARLDYPPEKLDVILALEADDRETRAAIARGRHRLPVTVVTVPAGGPRTKPKALNAALPFARGAFTVVYDAEDRPEPGQLRRALQAFAAAGDDLACVQARLCIDNIEDGWLTRLFSADYAGQFDVFLDGLAALRLPLPLGGSSNHFPTAVLRAAGAWDPYNVTEDADLGVRLARLGYRAAMIASTTYEEAPARLGAWLRQRTRWFKGWIQTWLVHMRAPRRLWRDLGPAGFVAVQLVVGGNVLAALIHPLALAAVAGLIAGGGDTAAVPLAFYGAGLVLGYAASALIAWVGLRRRGLSPVAWVLLLLPLHWLLLSLAAWRALLQLLLSPHRWEKTEHGLSPSRERARLLRAVSRLEQEVRQLEAIGALKPRPRAPKAPQTQIRPSRRKISKPRRWLFSIR